MRRTFLATAPPWLVIGLSAFVSIAVLTITEAASWPSSLVFACLAAAFSAPFLWMGVRNVRRETGSITGPLTRTQQRSVFRAAATGMPPADPALHRAALDVARYQFREAIRQRTGMIAICGIMLGVTVLVAVTDRSPWFAVCAILILAMLAETLLYPSRQRRRITQLEQATGTPGHPAHV